MARTVAVTGATGFIGRALLDKLVASGWAVRALTRRALPGDNHSAISWIRGDLDDLAALRSLVKDAHAVIHCAGTVKGKSWHDFHRANVVGTRNILQIAAEAAQAPKFLYISSLAAREPGLSWYARSKFEAEQLMPLFSDRLTLAVLRPAAVYGPGDKALRPLFQSMRYGIFPALGAPGNRFGLVHVYDLLAAINCWLDAARPVTGTYEIDDGTPGGYDYVTIARIAQAVTGKPVRYFYLPWVGMQLIANLNLWLARLLNYAPMLTPGKVQELRHPDWVCDISPLLAALDNWHPVIRLQAALPELIKS
ncbi:MAG TPA: NAD-dependent epimerase/dehydratase family protein [Nitrosomonas halophila]|nr:NAD-dependent epimerase/dehydratase family protein [Nitrosomonas halophila]